ncbi:MAG: ABC transporter permease, partial [Burkholderiaceae bacterium]
VFEQLAMQPQVTFASPVLEQGATLLVDGRAVPLRIVGVDVLVLPTIAPSLMPVPAKDADRFALFAPGQVFLNAAARKAVGSDAKDGDGDITVRIGTRTERLHIAGTVAAGGTALAVMDIGAAQDLLGQPGQLDRLTRVDLRLATGTDRAAFIAGLSKLPDWPSNLQVAEPGDEAERVSNLSRAYRVNLTVLALVALFTGAFLVFSVLALSVAKRAQQFALLGVLGLTPRERLRLVLAESFALGVVGSVAGLLLGTALAVFALRVLGGDLGGGYFAGVAPGLHWSSGAAAVYGVLGVVAALVGGWWPARAAQRMPEAQTLKGLGASHAGRERRWIGIALIAAGALLALSPPVFGIPIAAYFSVGLLLVGGIAALPWLIALAYDRVAPLVAHRLLPLLAVERARRMRGTAAVAVSGVVASLALAVALTVMVASFRDSVTRWLDVVLPADLYMRVPNSNSEPGAFAPAFVQQIARLPGVQRVGTTRTRSLQLDPAQPAVSLVSRSFDSAGPAGALPLVGTALPVPRGQVGIYVSEAMVDLYGAKPGTSFAALARALEGGTNFFVAGVWRDYVRQFGSIVIDAHDFERLTGERDVSDIAIWLAPGAAEAQVQQAARTLTRDQLGIGDQLEFASVTQLRTTSLRIFDRSFAVTYWLQAVAIAIGLFGIAASFSAQVLARRKEFGLLVHLGFTRRQVLTVVAGEGAAWTAIGALAGLALGLAVSIVLVHVVNPQSFHWTMDLLVPWERLALLCAAVIAAGTVTAWLAGRAAAGHDAVLAVKEDW